MREYTVFRVRFGMIFPLLTRLQARTLLYFEDQCLSLAIFWLYFAESNLALWMDLWITTAVPAIHAEYRQYRLDSVKLKQHFPDSSELRAFRAIHKM